MKRIRLALLALTLAAPVARADLIVSFGSVEEFHNSYLLEYFIRVTSGSQVVRGDFFTISGISGLLGPGTPLSGWTSVLGNTGNTFTYNGTTPLGVGTYSPFIFQTLTSNAGSGASWNAQATDLQTGGKLLSSSSGPTILVPVSAPEPSTVLLVGTGFLSLATLRRRRLG